MNEDGYSAQYNLYDHLVTVNADIFTPVKHPQTENIGFKLLT